MCKDIIAAAEYSDNFSENGQSACQKHQQSLIINHSCKDSINYISTDLSVEMVNTHNDGQNSDRWNRGFRSWIKFEILFQRQYNFLLLILQER